MDRPSRRDLLAATSALVAGILLPFDVTGARLSPDELETQAVALRQRVSLTVRSVYSPSVALATAQTHYHAVNAALARSARPQQRRALHRAASTTARVCALASRWCSIDGDQWLTIAEAEAKAAADGPLQAEAWMERTASHWIAETFADQPAPERLALATKALDRAGLADEQATVRAFAREDRAFELAVAGERHAALVELDMAVQEAQKGGWRAPAVHEMAGSGLRKAGRAADAEPHLARALDQPPVRRVWVLCEIAQAHLALDEVDAAAQDLEEAFLLTRAHGITGRLPRILAVKALLPPGRAARELDEVMHGA